MLESVSPYELLRASIPKSVTEKCSPYDQISTKQTLHTSYEPSLSADLPADKQNTPPASIFPASANPSAHSPQTHYISDIRRRHDSAIKKAFLP